MLYVHVYITCEYEYLHLFISENGVLNYTNLIFECQQVIDALQIKTLL